MRVLIHKLERWCSPDSLARRLDGVDGLILLKTSPPHGAEARYSFLVARPFLKFRSVGVGCELGWAGGQELCFGDPWRVLQGLLARYEVLDQIDLPFPLGGCFGYFGYELKNFVEPRLSRLARRDLELPECSVGFYDSVVAFDHELGATWIIATGLDREGSRDEHRARDQLEFWLEEIVGSGRAAQPAESSSHPETPVSNRPAGRGSAATERSRSGDLRYGRPEACPTRERTNHGGKGSEAAALEAYPLDCAFEDRVDGAPAVFSNLSRSAFLTRIERVQGFIRSGDVYQLNLSQRVTAVAPCKPWQFFEALTEMSPAPFSAYMDGGDFQLSSSSPELFLRLSGAQVQTQPIKGTRPRSADPTRDSQLSYQLQTSAKEMAELVMITDLLRNDLGRICEFGSVVVTDLARLERFAQVQHLVSTVAGTLRPGITHLDALAACFPGGSITGAPKVRAMELIDELEPVCRGPYTGALGYLGFNRESQLSILIRTALHKDGQVHFPVGAGIVADSVPEQEYEETIAKARGFLDAFRFCSRAQVHGRLSKRQICS